MTKEVRSLKTIEVGEELCVSYILSYSEQFMSSKERKARLSGKWKFDCQCFLCNKDIEANDNKRQMLKSKHQSISKLLSEKNFRAATEAAENLLQEMRKDVDEFVVFIPSTMMNVYIVSEFARDHGQNVPYYSHYVDESLRLAKTMGDTFVKELKQHLKQNS